MLLRVGDDRIRVLREILLRRLSACPRSPAEIRDGRHLERLAADLRDVRAPIYLRLKVYRPEYHDLFGLFPAYLVVPDLHLIMHRDAVVPPEHPPDAPGAVHDGCTERSRMHGSCINAAEKNPFYRAATHQYIMFQHPRFTRHDR